MLSDYRRGEVVIGKSHKGQYQEQKPKFLFTVLCTCQVAIGEDWGMKRSRLLAWI